MLTLLFAGCWPYIPGTWEDYDVPETAQVVGNVGWTDVLGDYWVDPADYGYAYWGFLKNATSTHAASELEYVVDGCTTEAADLDWFLDGVQGVTSKTSKLQGSPEISLAWDSDLQIMYTDTTEESAGTYSLASFQANDKKYSATDALIMPAPVDFHMETFDVEEAPEIAASELSHITWEARDDSALFVNGIISIVVNNKITEQIRCGTTLSAGELDLEVDQLEGFSEADYVLYTLTVFRETAVRLDGSEHAARFVGSRSQIGGAFLK